MKFNRLMKRIFGFLFLALFLLLSCAKDDDNSDDDNFIPPIICEEEYFSDLKNSLIGSWNYVNESWEFCDKTPGEYHFDTTIVFFDDNRLFTNIADGYFLGEANGALVEYEISCGDSLIIFSNRIRRWATYFQIDGEYLCIEDFYISAFGFFIPAVFKKEN